jgi:hypothetical protein
MSAEKEKKTAKTGQGKVWDKKLKLYAEVHQKKHSQPPTAEERDKYKKELRRAVKIEIERLGQRREKLIGEYQAYFEKREEFEFERAQVDSEEE